MQAATTLADAEERPDRSTPASGRWMRRLLSHRLQAHVVCVAISAAFFVADLVLPRGASPAIGYCLVPVVARATGRRFLLSLTAICTILAWLGYFLEPAGAPWWMSVFDRAMVSGVLWLTLLLVWRRMDAEVALARQAQALRDAVSELHRSNEELEAFASVVSHDIRGPLHSIRLVAQLIDSRPSVRCDEQCGEWVRSIQSEVDRMGGLVQALLAYGRVGAGEVRLSECDCESVLSRVRQALRAELEGAGAQVTNDPLPTVWADPTLMAELLQNLIENCIKYRGPAALRIHVSARPTPQGWLFAVRDNGIGMRPEDAARVFEPFHRGGAVQSIPGAGLGLATCRRIVARHGGRIEVESSPGSGCTFTFLIPEKTSRPPSAV